MLHYLQKPRQKVFVFPNTGGLGSFPCLWQVAAHKLRCIPDFKLISSKLYVH